MRHPFKPPPLSFALDHRDYDQAKRLVFLSIQREHFDVEIQHLVDYKVLEADARKSKDLRAALNKSQLKDFNPFVDAEGLIRIGSGFSTLPSTTMYAFPSSSLARISSSECGCATSTSRSFTQARNIVGHRPGNMLGSYTGSKRLNQSSEPALRAKRLSRNQLNNKWPPYIQ